MGAQVVVVGANFERGRSATWRCSATSASTRPVPLVEGVPPADPAARRRGEVDRAASCSADPWKWRTVVAGDARGGRSASDRQRRSVRICSSPNSGSTPVRRSACGRRTSIGVNPHYGGEERRIEAFLLDYEGDLYGRRLVVELWERLRDERAFDSEADLIEQIGRDVEAARAAVRPV
jgi:riboflavin kinase/FMN adenylyltransferase